MAFELLIHLEAWSRALVGEDIAAAAMLITFHQQCCRGDGFNDPVGRNLVVAARDPRKTIERSETS